MKRGALILLGIVVALLAATQVWGQSADGLIYGKVYTKKNIYEGYINWGKEEVLWIDFFNAAKTTAPSYISDALREKSSNTKEASDFDWSISGIWQDKKTSAHQFTTQFGNIKELKVIDAQRVEMVLKSGIILTLNGIGYNDIGTVVYIEDSELGTIEAQWTSIQRIEFMEAPQQTTSALPLYGMVETVRKGKHSGFVQWGRDERLFKHTLDGNHNGARVSILMSDIVSIEREGQGSTVITKLGKKYFLTGTNDVNNENSGLVVTQPELGSIDIPWMAFKKVTFSVAPNGAPSYAQFSARGVLEGTVRLFNESAHKGVLVFDLDETLQIETLEGKDDELNYTIPFHHIKLIKPKNSGYSQIVLRNGEILLLGESRDVSAENDGVYIYKGKKLEGVYAKWRDIMEIEF